MTLGLKYLNLSHCKLPIDALKHLLLGLACNEATADVELNIRCGRVRAANKISQSFHIICNLGPAMLNGCLN